MTPVASYLHVHIGTHQSEEIIRNLNDKKEHKEAMTLNYKLFYKNAQYWIWQSPVFDLYKDVEDSASQ